MTTNYTCRNCEQNFIVIGEKGIRFCPGCGAPRGKPAAVQCQACGEPAELPEDHDTDVAPLCNRCREELSR